GRGPRRCPVRGSTRIQPVVAAATSLRSGRVALALDDLRPPPTDAAACRAFGEHPARPRFSLELIFDDDPACVLLPGASRAGAVFRQPAGRENPCPPRHGLLQRDRRSVLRYVFPARTVVRNRGNHRGAVPLGAWIGRRILL